MSVENPGFPEPEEENHAPQAEGEQGGESRDEYPLVEISPEDIQAVRSTKSEPLVSDYLRYKGIQPDTGPVEVSFPGLRFRVHTDSRWYGGLYEPKSESLEGPVNPITGDRSTEYDPNSPIVEVTDQTYQELKEQLGYFPTIADFLRRDGIAPDSGLVRYKQDQHWIYVRTDGENYGKFYQPVSEEQTP